MAGLYVHVPFCGSICSYCHFARTARHDADLRRQVVEATVTELSLRRERCPILAAGRRSLSTAYIGGGTPSQLEPELMETLLAGTVGTLPTAPDFELTAEANPESLSADLAAVWRAAGIERVSLGVQSFDARVLKLLGRRCDPETARRGLDLACRTFPRVSADWIVGPGLESSRLLAELDEALARGVEHVSLYILELHEGTELASAVAAGELVLPPDAETEAHYLACVEHLAARGLRQYEVSNFARPGAESRHNQAYWRGTPYLGLGPSAGGFWGRRRYTNEAAPVRYVERVAAGEVPEAVVDPLNPAARRLEALILPLRTVAGLPLDRLPPHALDLERGVGDGLWTLDGGCLRLTPRGFLCIDSVEERLASALG